jgi:outer membrane protein TolC
MARDSERLAADAFTRASVEDYLQAAAEQRARIELAIAEAERRRERAVDALRRLDGLAPTTAPELADAEPMDAGATGSAPTGPGSSPNGSGPEARR